MWQMLQVQYIYFSLCSSVCIYTWPGIYKPCSIYLQSNTQSCICIKHLCKMLIFLFDIVSDGHWFCSRWYFLRLQFIIFKLYYILSRFFIFTSSIYVNDVDTILGTPFSITAQQTPASVCATDLTRHANNYSKNWQMHCNPLHRCFYFSGHVVYK